jgi:cellulose synthase/poly-beta-1,6-N-acetylglucosamine synthase-like glycosyltransferase
MSWYDPIAWLAIAAQLLFVFHAVRNHRYARSKCRWHGGEGYKPRVLLVVPCKGLDTRFAANITSFLKQDYDNYRVFFVVEAEDDPAYERLKEIRAAIGDNCPAMDVRILIAGASTSRSQKIHNLLYAYDHLPDETEVLAFGDSDVCVHRDWLARLVWPLRRAKCGVATGYRWFVPARQNLATLALSALNGSVAQLLGNSRFNHAWGGSMAIRTADFRRLGLPKIWGNTISDDLSLSVAVRKAGMRVTFVPGCLVPSLEAVTWQQLAEFARRQFLITRVCTPGTWWLGLLSSAGSVAGLWGGIAAAAHAATSDLPNVGLYTAVPVVFLVGQIARAVLRQALARRILSEYRAELRRAAWADVLGGALGAVMMLVLIVSSAFGRTICWRGIRYRLDGPYQTTVLSDA